MADLLKKYLFENRTVKVQALRLHDTWRDAQVHHDYPPAIQRILGELVAASALLAANLKFDDDDIVIDEGTNIQEGSVLHVDAGTPMHIGAHVTVGHQAMLHGCTVLENSLIGMQAIVLNGAVIGRNVLVGAGALIPEGKIIPDNVLVIGIGKIQRELTEKEIASLHQNNLNYIERARMFRTQLQRM